MKAKRRKRPVWPGPECLVNEQAERASDYLQRGMTVAFVAAYRPVRERNLADEHRIHGIALAHERARARNQRWLAWLAAEDACEGGIAFAATHMSPEAAVHAAAAEQHTRPYACWLVATMPFTFAACPGCSGDATELLASPEWLSLPWQRDPT